MKMIIGVSNTFDNLQLLMKVIEHSNMHEYLFKRTKKQIEAKYMNHIKKENLVNEEDSNFSYDYVDCMPTGNVDIDNN